MAKKETSNKPSASKRSAALTKKSLIAGLRLLKWVFILMIIFGFLAAGISFGYVSALVKDDPIRPQSEIFDKINQNELTGYVYFNDDSVIGQLRTDEDRILVNIDDVPAQLKDAFLSTEDNDFYDHYGFDFKGLLRAVKQKLLHEPVQTGGSTITQQVARRVFLSLDRTDSRKAKEILLSMRLERIMTKDQIFEAYLNKIPFGNGSSGYNLYGIKAAAKGIFGITDLNQLNIAQCAYLAGLPQAPSDYSAFSGKGEFDPEGFKLAHERQQLVLKRMLEEKRIDHRQYEEALNFDIKASLSQYTPKAYTTYPYLMIEVEQQAAKIMLRLENPDLADQDLSQKEYAQSLSDASEHMRRNGYKVYTTIDEKIYDSMQEIAHNADNFLPDDTEAEDPKQRIQQIGAIMIDNKTGAILGLLGGRDFYTEQLNHATQMLRQPGSTMKPVAAYIPALESGAIQPASPIDDVPIVLPDGQKGFHIPENWNNQFQGMISARTALNQSYNIPAIYLFNDVVGIENAWDFAKQLGITTLTESDQYARTGVIGGLKYGVTVEELTNAYAAMGNQGVFNDAYMIRKIEDANGRIVYEHKEEPKRVFSEQTAFLITDMLKTVITSGTATDIRQKFKNYNTIPVVGKTGSTQNDYDAWFMGYSPDITVGVWSGYDHQKRLPSGKGTQGAKNIWSLIMNAAVEEKPELFPTKEFAMPQDIVKMTVSSITGKLPSELAVQSKLVTTDWFNKKWIPTEEVDALKQMKVVSYNNFNYIALPTTPEDFIQDKVVYERKQPIKQIIDNITELFKKYPNSIPFKSRGVRMTPEDYYPKDMDKTAPTEVDPRVDDGVNPAPPTDVALEPIDDLVKITFTPSANEDVVGYRIYRSMNGGPFEKLNAVVMTGQESQFKNYITPAFHYAYYLTAVDVAGKESAPTPLVYSNKDDAATGYFPIVEQGQPSGNEQANSNPFAPPSPTGVTVKAMDSGLGVHISWNPVAGPPGSIRYNVYYSSERNGTYSKIQTLETREFDYMMVPANGWYRVAAENGYGESPPSAPSSYSGD